MVIIIRDNNHNKTKTRGTRSASLDSISSTIDTTHSPSSLKKNDVTTKTTSSAEEDTSRDDKFCLVSGKDSGNNDNIIRFDCTTSLECQEKELILRALSSIVVLADNDNVRHLLNTYHGKMITIGSHILEGLRLAAPNRFAGRVADFNDNLFYEMQDGGRDIRSIISSNNNNDTTNDNDNKDNELLLLNNDIEMFDKSLRMALLEREDNDDNNKKRTKNATTITYRGSFMQTETTIFQPAHVDYDWPILQQCKRKLHIAFFPLTHEGAFIQLWKEDDDQSCSKSSNIVNGTVVYIPYGKMLIVPSDTIHGGGFKRGMGGNLRFHLYIAVDDDDENDEGRLPRHQTNKYTEEHDKRRELCERFLDAPGLDSLLGPFFDTNACM